MNSGLWFSSSAGSRKTRNLFGRRTMYRPPPTMH